MIDSELVPWGKGEKQAGKADEIVFETIYLQWVEAQVTTSVVLLGDSVPIEEWANELSYVALFNPYREKA